MDADDLRRFRKSSRSLGGRIDCDLGSLGQPHNRFGTRNVCSSIVSRREDAISGHLVHVWARRTVFQRVPISALRDSPERLVLGGGALCFAIFCNALRNRNVSFFLADGLDGWCRAPAGGLCADQCPARHRVGRALRRHRCQTSRAASAPGHPGHQLHRERRPDVAGTRTCVPGRTRG